MRNHHAIRLAALTFLVSMLTGCPSAVKPTLRTVNDVARAACEAAFGEQPPPEGLTVKEVCEEHERLKPFIDAILAARQDVGVELGEAPKE